jgi:hypothetical protein
MKNPGKQTATANPPSDPDADVERLAAPAPSDDVRRWIAEILLLDVPAQAIVEQLGRQGWQQAAATEEVRRAVDSPYLQGAGLLRNRIAKRDWILASIGRLARVDHIDRADRLSADDFFRSYYAGHRPVIIAGLVDDWPAMKSWNIDYFEEVAGSPLIEIQSGRDSTPAYERESERLKRKVPFAEYLRLLRHGGESNDYYLTAKNGTHNRGALAPLWEDIGPIPGYLVPDGESDGYLWLGPKGTVTPFHHDLTNNLFVQVVGRKKFTLVPSWDTPKMLNFEHCFSGWTGPEALAALPPDHRPTMLECVLEPGEALFIPVGWWHHVEGLDVTISMSFTNFVGANDFHRGYTSFGRM